MKKHLKLQIVAEGPTFVRFRISEQTHRGEKFGEHDKASYRAGGVILMSSSCPAVQLNKVEKVVLLFVRGADPKLDNKEMTVSQGVFETLLEAVDAYNRSFGTTEQSSVDYAEQPDKPLPYIENKEQGEPMKKHIKLYVEEKTDEIVRFYIEEQTHCLQEFGKDSDRFVASNGVTLFSGTYPCVAWVCMAAPPTFCVQGSDHTLDKFSIITARDTFNDISKAVWEYNNAFGSGDMIAFSYAPAATHENAPREIQVYRVISERDLNDEPGVVILVIGAETYDEALQIAWGEGYAGPGTIECLHETIAKERGILHRTVFDVLVRRGHTQAGVNQIQSMKRNKE